MDGKYCLPSGTIATEEDPPLFLIEGQFYDGQKLSVEDIAVPEVPDELLNSGRIIVSGYEEELTVRMLANADGTLYLIGTDGELSETPYTRDGSYIVFSIPNGSSFCYVVNSLRSDLHRLSLGEIIGIALGLICALVLIASLIKRREKRGRTEAPENASESSVGSNVPGQSEPDEPDSEGTADKQGKPAEAEETDQPVPAEDRIL